MKREYRGAAVNTPFWCPGCGRQLTGPACFAFDCDTPQELEGESPPAPPFAEGDCPVCELRGERDALAARLEERRDRLADRAERLRARAPLPAVSRIAAKVCELRTLVGDYWDLAYAEGAGGRDRDTVDGAAQRKWEEISSAIDALSGLAPPAPAQPLTVEHAYAASLCGTPQSLGIEAAGGRCIVPAQPEPQPAERRKPARADTAAEAAGIVRARFAWTDALRDPAPEPQERPWPRARDVKRRGDMGEAQLRVLFDNDNDVIVELWEPGNRSIAVEFCNGMSGGGKSPRTRMALVALMCAMEADAAIAKEQAEPTPMTNRWSFFGDVS